MPKYTAAQMAEILSAKGKPISSRRVRRIAQMHGIGQKFGSVVAFDQADISELMRARGVGRDCTRRPKK